MSGRSEEEKARRKSDYLQRVAARKAARPTKHTSNSPPSESPTNLVQQATQTHSTTSSTVSWFSILPEDTLHGVFCFLTSRELGALSLTCKALNETLMEGRISHLISRLNHSTLRNRSRMIGHSLVPLNLCQDPADARVRTNFLYIFCYMYNILSR